MSPVKIGYENPNPEVLKPFDTINDVHPALYDRLLRAYIQNPKCGGMSQWIKYEGDEMNGEGVVVFRYMYGITRSKNFSVVNGVVKFLGRSLDMRKLMRTWRDPIGGTPMLDRTIRNPQMEVVGKC